MLTVRSQRVVLRDGIRPAAILVRDGRIVHIGGWHEQATAIPVLDAGELLVLPGLVDSHVHINEPGRTEWEGFTTATRAAAAGGITTLVDMPLNSVPATTTVAAFDEKLRAADGRSFVDLAFWGGVVPGNVADLEPLARRGVAGFKCFLSPSGVDEFQHVTEADLREALPVLAALGLPLLAHAELPAELLPIDPAADPRQYQTWLESRPPRAEVAAIEMLITLASSFHARVHIVHLATREALPALAAARRAGVHVTVETCPHYLMFCAEDIPVGGTSFKCAPPIRGRDEREALWAALAAGDIDLVASDHSPAPPDLKHASDGDFIAAWGGIASLQLGLPLMGTAASARGFGIDRVVHWMSTAPARIAGLHATKGEIAVGRDADLVFYDPDVEFTVDPTQLEHRHALTPYAGMKLRGRVTTTVLRGEPVFKNGEFTRVPNGRFVNIARA